MRIDADEVLELPALLELQDTLMKHLWMMIVS